MAILDSIQRNLDSAVSRSLRAYADTAQDAEESGSQEDLQAFNNAMEKVAISTSASNQEMQMKHNLTKSIIDGFQ